MCPYAEPGFLLFVPLVETYNAEFELETDNSSPPEAIFDIPPVRFGSPGAFQVPAFLFSFGAQFRKDCGLPKNQSYGWRLEACQRFFRNWGPDQSERPAGSWQEDTLQGHWHTITEDKGRKFTGYTEGGDGPGWGAGYGNTYVQARAIIAADGYGLPRVAIETRPVNISQPACLYLGRPA